VLPVRYELLTAIKQSFQEKKIGSSGVDDHNVGSYNTICKNKLSSSEKYVLIIEYKLLFLFWQQITSRGRYYIDVNLCAYMTSLKQILFLYVASCCV
jgi:hypothetical protein